MHIPVMKDEVIDILDIKPGLFYIDATFGEGGHTKSILEKGGIVLSIDRDSSTKKHADIISKEFPDMFLWVHDSFSNIYNIWKENFYPMKVDGILFDLGFSSNQIEDPERGFSFLHDSNLDMRYNTKEGDTALNFINQVSFEELSDIILKYGQDYKAKLIAKTICEYREKHKIKSCFELLNILKPIIKNKHNKHFATKFFQAIRIHINNEFEHIENGINNSLKILRYYGKIVVITFHSLEDRLIKNIFGNNYLKEPSCNEVKTNMRARSAKVRWFVEKKGLE